MSFGVDPAPALGTYVFTFGTVLDGGPDSYTAHTTAVSTDTWYRVDIKYDFTTSKLTVQLDGNVVVNDETIPSLPPGDILALVSLTAKGASDPQSVYFDDFYIETF